MCVSVRGECNKISEVCCMHCMYSTVHIYIHIVMVHIHTLVVGT